jgi:ABC-type transport system involved in multi-copper enzyme maturation permease subunit
MSRLLRLQLFRALRDKGTIVFGIITLVLGVLSTILNFWIFRSIGTGLFGDITTIASMIQATFSLTSTPLILLIIMGVVLLYKESSWGTIRNQVVAGYSKVKIYLANFLAMLIIIFSILLAYQMIILGLGSILGLKIDIDNSQEFLVFLRSYGLNLLILIVEVGFMTFISLYFQNIIAPIFLVIVLPIFIGPLLAYSLPIVVLLNPTDVERAKLSVSIYEYFIWYQNYSLTANNILVDIGDFFGGQVRLYDTGSLAFILKTIFVNLGFGGVFLGLGSLVFARKDLK